MENSSGESLPSSSDLSTETPVSPSDLSTAAQDLKVSSPSFKNAASPYSALTDSMREGVGNGPRKMRFFGPRFMTIWVMPIAVTGILMEFLFVGPLRNVNPLN